VAISTVFIPFIALLNFLFLLSFVVRRLSKFLPSFDSSNNHFCSRIALVIMLFNRLPVPLPQACAIPRPVLFGPYYNNMTTVRHVVDNYWLRMGTVTLADNTKVPDIGIGMAVIQCPLL